MAKKAVLVLIACVVLCSFAAILSAQLPNYRAETNLESLESVQPEAV